MRAPFTQLFVHLVWSTWDRMPLLTPAIQPRVHAFLQSECQRMGAEAIAIGGIDNHVHVLARIPAALSVAALVKQLKGASSHFVNHELPKAFGFRWQGAYGAFTVSKGNVPRVRAYVLNQEEHHRLGTIHPALEQDSAE